MLNQYDVIGCDQHDFCLRKDKFNSEFALLLNGNWKFNWSENPSLRPEAFYQGYYDVSSWDEIKVPSDWQMEGYGLPIHAYMYNRCPIFGNLYTQIDGVYRRPDEKKLGKPAQRKTGR